MKSKLVVHKSRSPIRYDFGRGANKLAKNDQTPRALPLGKVKLPKNELAELFVKRARSNSPRKVAKNILNIKPSRSPFVRKNLPLDNSGSKANTSQRVLKIGQSPGRIQNKTNPDRLYTKNNLQPFESEELKALKLLAKKRHRLNKDLWEAAENGDIKKINELLNPYFKVHTIEQMN